MFLFYIWCVSVAADEKTYLVAANSEADARATIPSFLRWDCEVHYANHFECRKLGIKFDEEHVVVFDDKFFVYNLKEKRFEMDCLVNYAVRPDLK